MEIAFLTSRKRRQSFNEECPVLKHFIVMNKELLSGVKTSKPKRSNNVYPIFEMPSFVLAANEVGRTLDKIIPNHGYRTD